MLPTAGGRSSGRTGPLPVMLHELALGWRRIADFARSFPVFVAPWNRMDPHVLGYLSAAGLRAVSTLGPRDTAEPSAGIRRTNVHVDIIDWQGTPGFVGLERALDHVVTHLRQRRTGAADADEPTGLMTHHGFHDEGCWGFIADFLRRSRAHPAARWLPRRGRVLAMSLLAYPRAAAFGDLVRALLGAGVVLVPVAAVPTGPVVTVLALAAVAVFAALGLRAALLLCTRFEIDETGIAALGPINRAVSWRDLRMVKLAYYSTRRDRSGGWLQLTLVGEAAASASTRGSTASDGWRRSPPRRLAPGI